ncbi:uncharacterized protein VTP21DRAFT_9845 [Calcarisporiella thermophila]|uniref:uncharacterized protein n=1 Tax=Calcarisporiella thermophila TaxID=911321 RepID=UPI0037443C08
MREMYSGQMPRPVPSLTKLCQNAIIKNLDMLSDVGDVPWRLLEPILKMATPRQLTIIEQHNKERFKPADTDYLWEKHCLENFREVREKYIRGELGKISSWRKLFLSCENEKEKKMQEVGAKLRDKYKKLEEERRRKQLKITASTPSLIRKSEKVISKAQPKPKSLMDKARREAKKICGSFWTPQPRSPACSSSSPAYSFSSTSAKISSPVSTSIIRLKPQSNQGSMNNITVRPAHSTSKRSSESGNSRKSVVRVDLATLYPNGSVPWFPSSPSISSTSPPSKVEKRHGKEEEKLLEKRVRVFQ